MSAEQWITLSALSLLLVEGFALSVYPHVFREFLLRTEPRTLQLIGLAETIIAAGLIFGLLSRSG